VPKNEAQPFIDMWWKRFPAVYAWTKEIEKQVIETGEIQSPFGHKRRFYVIPADNFGRQHIVKEGINFQPQNIAANITLWALCNLVDLLNPDIAQVRITVHDSILVNCRNDSVEEVARLMKSVIEATPKEALGWEFPFLCDLSVGPNYGQMEELKL
jgi:DNA polymerase-1